MPAIPKNIGRYEILELVGRGGMGVLYRARDPMLERDVALKMMLLDFTMDQAARDRFQREAKAIARLQHRNVVTVHELGEMDGTPYIVMEFLGGKDLDTLMHGGRTLSLVEKLDVVIQLCEGLGYAHEQGIVHRDIKPGNVRVLDDGTVKILDFGIAKFAMSSMTQSGTIMGTPSYMAPEQVMGKQIDGRADLFAAGVLLYELLSGQKPFEGDSPTAVVYQIMHAEPPPVRGTVPELPEALNEIVARALQKNPDDRYNKASEMASDLQMVKLMVDLPLKPQEAEHSGDTTRLTLGKLYANTPRPRTGSPVAPTVLETPMRPSAAARAADAAPRASAAEEAGGRSFLVWGVAALVVVIVGLAVMFALRSHSATPAGAASAAKAAGAAATTNVFVVSSTPPGAKILVNGADTGKVTPAAVPLGAALPSSVELNLKGYQPLVAKVTDADLKSGGKEFRLAREAGPVRLTISASYPFELVQGSKVVSPPATRHEVTVQPGGGALIARSQELFLNSPVSLDFQRSQADVTLPAPGTISVFAAVETCKVSIDEQDLGFPPIAAKRIAAGSHTVALKCPDGKGESQRTTISPGEAARVTFGPPKGGQD